MLICLKVSVEWPGTWTCWNLENCGFSICTSSTTGWISWDDSIATLIGFVMKTTSLTNIIGLSWMLVITQCRLGSGSSSIMSYVAVASSFSPPLSPFSSKHVHSSSFSKSLTSDSKIVLDFFLGSEVIGSRLNLSLGVGSYVHIFNWWD